MRDRRQSFTEPARMPALQALRKQQRHQRDPAAAATWSEAKKPA